MRPILVVFVVTLVGTVAPAADFQFTNVQGPNFVLLGDPIDYHIGVAPGSTTATATLVNDPLPTGISYIDATLICYIHSGSCQYTPAPPTISYTGTMDPFTAADIVFSASSSGLPASGYVHNQVTFSATGFNTVQRTRTTVAYTEDEWPVYGDAMRLSESDADWYAGECTGVAWNPAEEVFSAVWIRTDQMTSQRYLQTRTIDLDGNRGETQQVNQVIPGEEPYNPAIACSHASGYCLVAWAEVEPVTWQRGIRTRLLDSSGLPIGNEVIVIQGGGYPWETRVIYNSVLDEFLVVYWTDRDSGVTDVAAQRVRASDGALLGSAIIHSGPDFDRERPDVAFLADWNEYLIVYTCEDPAGNRQVRGKLAPADLSGVGSDPEITIAAAVADDYWPAVEAHGDGFLVAWARRQGTPAAVQIRARRVSSSGIPQGGASGFLINGFSQLPGGYVTDVQFAGEQGFLVGWNHSDSSSVTGPDHHGRFVELGEDQPAYLEFPTFSTVGWDQWGSFACNEAGRCLIAAEITDGVDARFVSAWRAHIDGFEDGGFGGWDAVVGAIP